MYDLKALKMVCGDDKNGKAVVCIKCGNAWLSQLLIGGKITMEVFSNSISVIEDKALIVELNNVSIK